MNEITLSVSVLDDAGQLTGETVKAEDIVTRQSEVVVDQKTFRGHGVSPDIIVTWFNCKVTLKDGREVVIREVHHETFKDSQSASS